MTTTQIMMCYAFFCSTFMNFVKPVIASVLGNKVKIVDGSIGTAKELKRRLKDAGLLKGAGEGGVVFENSRNTDEELELCRRLFNC
jgi:glutamate racemase